MRFWKDKNERTEMDELTADNAANARDIRHIRDTELKKVEERQKAISSRLHILQQELEVQTAQNLQRKD